MNSAKRGSVCHVDIYSKNVVPNNDPRGLESSGISNLLIFEACQVAPQPKISQEVQVQLFVKSPFFLQNSSPHDAIVTKDLRCRSSLLLKATRFVRKMWNCIEQSVLRSKLSSVDKNTVLLADCPRRAFP